MSGRGFARLSDRIVTRVNFEEGWWWKVLSVEEGAIGVVGRGRIEVELRSRELASAVGLDVSCKLSAP